MCSVSVADVNELTPLARLLAELAPESLLVPQFVYPSATPSPLDSSNDAVDQLSEEQPAFAFSALFVSSPDISRSRTQQGLKPESSRLPSAASSPQNLHNAFIGFTWGPALDHFDNSCTDSPSTSRLQSPLNPDQSLPRLRLRPKSDNAFSATPYRTTPKPNVRPKRRGRVSDSYLSALSFTKNSFVTPMRYPSSVPRTVPRTLNRTCRRSVSDRVAFQQLLGCVTASARKKVMESGKKPRNIPRAASEPLPVFSVAAPLGDEPKASTRQVKTKGKARRPLPVIQINPCLSISDDSAPPSPSPRPGSSASRRSMRSGTPSLIHDFGDTMMRATPSPTLGLDSSSSLGFTDERLDEMEDRLRTIKSALKRVRQRLQRLQ
jgi:hypothetical protein